MSYPQTMAYLKAKAKLNQIEANTKLLGSLTNSQEVQQIQVAVQERMGPSMCDNSAQQSRIQKDSYLQVLENYKREMRSSSASQQQQYNKMMSKLSEKQKQVQKQLNQQIKNWQQQRNQIKEERDRMIKVNSLQQLVLRTQKVQSELSQQLTQLTEQLEISILQEQISRRRLIDEVLKLANL